MPRRGENVYKRKDGRWEGRIRKPDGKYQCFYAKTYREVREKKKNLQEYADKFSKKTPDQAKSAPDLFDIWLEDCHSSGLKPSTYENYHACMKHYVIPYFRREPDEQLTVYATEGFVKSVRDNTSLSDSYKRKILSIFKTALRAIVKSSPEFASVPETVSLPRTESSEVQVFSVKEQRLVENIVLHSDDKRHLGILLCFYTGIRLGELCALKWDDIDIESGTMSITKTLTRTKNFLQGGNKTSLVIGMPKSRKSFRKIPIPGFLLKLYCDFKIKAADGNYILSGTDKPMDPRTYQKHYKKILKSAGVRDRKFHALRHTFATRALELGVDIKTLSEILGHANISITLNIYAHSLLEQKKIAIEKLNNLHVAHFDTNAFAVGNSVIPA